MKEEKARRERQYKLAEEMDKANKKYWELVKERRFVRKKIKENDTFKRFFHWFNKERELDGLIQKAWGIFEKKRDAYYKFVFPNSKWWDYKLQKFV